MAVPEARIDETKGLTLVSKDGQTREQTRYLFTAGDVIDPDRKLELRTLQTGGDEVAARCLRRTPNYVPRCEFTPLETWFEPIGLAELAGDRAHDLVTIGGAPEVVPQFVGPQQMYRQPQPMVGMPHYPGVDLHLILEVCGYRGVRELESLRGVDWEGGETQQIRSVFFPPDWPLPTPLRLIEERIREVSKAQPQLANLGEEMLVSCDVFRRWALDRIGVEHGLLATRKEHLFTYRYSRLAPQLLAQLEMNPKDQGSEVTQLAQAIVREFTQAHQTASPALDVEAIVKAVLMAQQALAVPKEEFACECGEKFDSSQKLGVHKARRCPLQRSE